MNSKGSVKYAYFSPRCESVMIESTKPVILPSGLEADESVENDTKKKDPTYYWQQSTDDIKIWFGLPRDSVKDDIKIEVTDKTLKVEVKSQVFINGNLFQRLNADLTSWSIDNNRYEIYISYIYYLSFDPLVTRLVSSIRSMRS